MKGKRGTREGEGLNEWTEKEEKEKKLERGDESVTNEREREREREREELIKWRSNKILVFILFYFIFTIVL